MLSNMKTTIFKFADLSWSALANIKSWFRQDIARAGFTLENFSNNPSMKVVQVENSVGQTIALCPIEPCFLVSQLINPEATIVETGVAGDYADRALARYAQQEGMTRFLIVCPPDYPSQADEKWVRIIERKVPLAAIHSVGCATKSTAAHIN